MTTKKRRKKVRFELFSVITVQDNVLYTMYFTHCEMYSEFTKHVNYLNFIAEHVVNWSGYK